MKKGLIQIYTGDGKGKTTATVGLAIRASAAGLKVVFLTFFKGRESSEFKILKKMKNIKFISLFTEKKFINEMTEKEIENLKKQTSSTFVLLKKFLFDKTVDVVIADEVSYPILNGFIDLNEFINVISSRNSNIELILTGRSMPIELIKIADLVTEMKKIKHPFDNGVNARKGIEF